MPLLIYPALVPQPAVGMAAMGILMGPVQNATLIIPDIFTGKGNPVSFMQVPYSWGQVYIMGHQQT